MMSATFFGLVLFIAVCSVEGKYGPWNGKFAKQGVYAFNSCETTPVEWHGRLLLMECMCATAPSHAGNWDFAFRGNSYFRIRDFLAGSILANVSASIGFGFCSAYVGSSSPTLWVFCTAVDRGGQPSPCTSGDCYIQSFWTSDMQTWSSRRTLTLPNIYATANSAVTYDYVAKRYVMMLDSTNQLVSKVNGYFATRPLTAAELKASVGSAEPNVDLSTGWTILNTTRYNANGIETIALKRWNMYDAGGCPAIKFVNGMFYVTSGGDVIPLARSATLEPNSWDVAEDLFLHPSPEDAAVSPYGHYESYLPLRIASILLTVPAEWDFCSNDNDLVEYRGQVWIVWGASAQGAIQYAVFGAVGIFNGTLAELYASYYPSDDGTRQLGVSLR